MGNACKDRKPQPFRFSPLLDFALTSRPYTASDSEVKVKSRSFIGGIIITVEDSSPATRILDTVLASGAAQGVFRAGLDPVDIHASISALTFFNVSNQHTFGLIFKGQALSRQALATRRANVVEMIVRFVRK